MDIMVELKDIKKALVMVLEDYGFRYAKKTIIALTIIL